MTKSVKKRTSGPSGANLNPRYTLRASQGEFDAWQGSADGRGVPLNRWIRDACNRSASHAPGSSKRTKP